MPFDPKAYLAKKGISADGSAPASSGGFDPKAYLAKKGISVESDGPSTAESALQGFGEGGTLGYLPQIQAAVGAAANQILPEKNPKLFGHEIPIGGGQTKDTYESLRNQFQKENEAKKAAHPIASAAGNLAGAMMTMPVGGAEAKGASILTKIAKAAGTGATYGALANPELANDASLSDNLSARANNMEVGALLGGASEGLVGAGSSILSKLGKKTSDQAVVKQIGANAGQIKRILKKDEIPKVENLLTNEGLLLPGNKVSDVADKTAEIIKTDGPKIGKLYSDAQAEANAIGIGQQHRINGNDLADKIVAKVKESSKNHPDRNLVMSTIEESVAPLRDMGDNANILDVHQFRKGLDENIDWSKASRERSAVQRAYVDARNIVADKTKNTINALDQSLGGNRLGELKNLNDRFSAASTVNNIATQAHGREIAKAFMGHGVIGGGAGLGVGALSYKDTGNPVHDYGKAAIKGIGAALSVTAARKLGVPVGYYGGKALTAIGNAAPSAGKVGVGATAPWINMQKQKEK